MNIKVTTKATRLGFTRTRYEWAGMQLDVEDYEDGRRLYTMRSATPDEFFPKVSIGGGRVFVACSCYPASSKAESERAANAVRAVWEFLNLPEIAAAIASGAGDGK